MTTISCWREGKDHHIKIQGHAGYAESGKDIVCAAISTLAYTLMNYLTNCEKEGVRVSYHLTEGLIHMFFSGPEEKISIAENVIITGFLGIEERYPDYLRVSWEEIKN